tara:strand:+ start:1053 stop:2009 length:957 start_codon:yes stop_codon:yes gene_type:complete
LSGKLIIFNKFDADLKKLWVTFENQKENPFLNYDVNKMWHDILGQNYKLNILTDMKSFIAPIAIKDNIAYFCGSKDVFDFHNLIYDKNINNQSIKLIIDHLLIYDKVLKIELNSIIQKSHLHDCLINLQDDYDIEFVDEDVSPGISLPDSFDEYLSNLTKKNRHEIRRKIRKFEKNFELKIINANHENVDKLLLEFIRLMKLNPEKKLFLNQDRVNFMSKIIKYSVLEGRGELNFIEINKDLVSTSFAFKNKEKLFVYNSGFNNDYSEYSVGLINHVYNIKNKIKTYNYIDFLRGDEEYKYRIGCEDRKLLTINIKVK